MFLPSQVLKVPDNIAYGGKGPLLSARLVDLDMMWTRAEQVPAVCAFRLLGSGPQRNCITKLQP